MSAKDKPHRHIAPRLASGLSRVATGHAMPEHIKRGLRMIAARENQSVSWIIEQIIYSYFGFAPPRFVGTRDAEVVNPDKHTKIVKQISRDKSARSKTPLVERGTQIIERANAGNFTH